MIPSRPHEGPHNEPSSELWPFRSQNVTCTSHQMHAYWHPFHHLEVYCNNVRKAKGLRCISSRLSKLDGYLETIRGVLRKHGLYFAKRLAKVGSESERGVQTSSYRVHASMRACFASLERSPARPVPGQITTPVSLCPDECKLCIPEMSCLIEFR